MRHLNYYAQPCVIKHFDFIFKTCLIFLQHNSSLLLVKKKPEEPNELPLTLKPTPTERPLVRTTKRDQDNQTRAGLTSTFSSRRCTFRASCSRVPTSGYLVSWKRFSRASSCSSVKMVRCLRLRRQCSWLRSWSSVLDRVPTFMYDIIWCGTGDSSTEPAPSYPTRQ